MKITLSNYNTGRAQIQLNDGQTFEFEMKNVRRHLLYDTVFIPGGAAPVGVLNPGARFDFFQNIQGKRPVDCNITTPRRLANGERMVVTRIGFYIPKSFDLAVSQSQIDTAGGADHVSDAQWLYENLYLELKLNGVKAATGPAWTFPAGYGVETSENYSPNSANDLGSSYSLNGSIANSLIKDFAVEQYLDSNTDIEAYVEVQTRAVFNAALTGARVIGDGVNAISGSSMKMLLEGILWTNS
jgi:hypothetical protein